MSYPEGIFNSTGQLITTLVRCRLPAGQYSVHWNGTNRNGQKINAGVYLYAIETNLNSKS